MQPRASDLRSRLLYHLRGRDLALKPLTGQAAATLTRTTRGQVLDRNGRYRPALHSQPRYEAVDLDGDGIRESLGIVVEAQRTNLFLRGDIQGSLGSTPTGFTAAIGANVFAVSNDVPSMDVGNSGFVGKHTFNNGGGDTNCGFQTITAAGSSTYVISFGVWIPADYDGSAVQCRAEGASLAASIGSVFDLTKREQWQRAFIVATTLGGGGSLSGLIRLAGASVGKFVYSDCWAAELAAYPTSWMQTDGATFTRNLDQIDATFDLGALDPSNDDITVYARVARPPHADVAGALGTNPGLFSIGGAVPRLGVTFNSASRQLVSQVDTAGTDASSTAAFLGGAAIEVCAQFQDLAVGGKTRFDAGSGFTGLSAAASAFAAIGDTTLRVGRFTDALDGVLVDLKIARGLYTLPQMQETL